MKPMLAGKLNWDLLRYPVYVSAKVDGIRCIVQGGEPRSRTWKVLPNKSLQGAVHHGAEVLEGIDGEIVVGSPNAPNVYNATMSGIMAEYTTPAFTYLVFDWVGSPRLDYYDRLGHVQNRADRFPNWVQVRPQVLCRNREEVEAIEEQHVSEGYEGIIVRSPTAPYKFNRSTVKEGYLLKLKRYADAEARVIGWDELMHNDNPGYIDAQGHTRHTSHQAGQRAGGILGALRVQLLESPGQPVVFSIGTGFDMAQREALWTVREGLIGKTVKFKYMPHGVLDTTGVPRHPVFLGFRDKSDM